ncbi:MAG: DUF6262 family protein [Gemmatimonadales bacterium]
MRADNTAFIVQAARDRRAATLRRAQEALQRLDRAGAAINFRAVAEAASVSRAWLYREPTLRAEIQRLRRDRASDGTGTAATPSAQRASSGSLQRRLEAAVDEIARLKQDNRQLRDQIARLHGERRGANPHSHRTGQNHP